VPPVTKQPPSSTTIHQISSQTDPKTKTKTPPCYTPENPASSQIGTHKDHQQLQNLSSNHLETHLVQSQIHRNPFHQTSNQNPPNPKPKKPTNQNPPTRNQNPQKPASKPPTRDQNPQQNPTHLDIAGAESRRQHPRNATSSRRQPPLTTPCADGLDLAHLAPPPLRISPQPRTPSPCAER
jgi:hypothetical protein